MRTFVRWMKMWAMLIQWFLLNEVRGWYYGNIYTPYYRAVGHHIRHGMRRWKWWSNGQLNDRPGTRWVYPLMQCVLWQRVWIVNGDWWVIARTAENAACYWAREGDHGWNEERDDQDQVKRIIEVRRPFGRLVTRWRVGYIGHTEWGAHPLDNE